MFEGVTHRVSAGGTGRFNGDVRPLGSKKDGNLTWSHIGDNHGNKERAYLFGSLLQHNPMIFFNGCKTTEAATDNDSNPIGVVVVNVQVGIV